MTKEEFVKAARSFGYAEKDIDEMIDMIESARKDDVPMAYEDIILIEQPKY